MLNLKSLFKSFLVLTISVILLSACQEKDSISFPDDISGNSKALQKLINEDELLSSFEANFEDDNMLSSLAKINDEIDPIKVRRKITEVDKNIELDISEDELTATGVVTKTITGKLIITVLDTDSSQYEIEKDFISIVTRNVEFEKYNNSSRPDKNWRMIRISLAEGNTGSNSVEITKLTLFMPDGSVIEIESPNEYYLERLVGKRNQVPNFNKHQEITVKAEVKSSFEGDDLVNLRYGAVKRGNKGGNKGKTKGAKQKFELISSIQDGAYYIKEYQATYTTNQTRGKKHAVVSVVSYSTIHDSVAPVESNSWGIPYIVN